MKKLVMFSVALAAIDMFAAIEVARPQQGSTVKLIFDEQKQVMALPTYAERLKFFEDDIANGKKIRHADVWRKAKELSFKWKATEGEKGPWEMKLSKNADMSDARVEIFRASPDKNGFYRFTFPYANYEIATTYYWQLRSNVSCGNWGHSENCSCTNKAKSASTEVYSFTTEDLAPRWIAIEGRTENMRDLGGRITKSGKRVKQGMIYRGQGLNDNSASGRIQGRNRLTVEDVKYLTKTLGIKTDLDLRGPSEVADMTESPLGKEVKFVHHSSNAYRRIFERPAMDVMAENFRLFCDEANYPVYFHCIAGADRTGSLAYILNGVLGVSQHDAETDWEQTFYPKQLPEMCEGYKKSKHKEDFWRLESHFTNGIAKYGTADDDFQRKVELYLLDCGVTMEEIEKFRSIMLK